METLNLAPATADKATRYQTLLPQIAALMAGEPDLIARMANTAAALKYGMDFFWVGFYLVKDGELVLGPFQGPIACTRIAHGRGVCGTAYAEARTVLVPDVNAFPGHIACSAESQSEIVVPKCDPKGDVLWILDVDSQHLNAFDDTDAHYLQTLMTFF